MQELINKMVIFSIIGMVVGLVKWKSIENRESVSSENNLVVCLPSSYKWVGLFGTLYFVLLAFGDILFPKIFVKNPLIENLLMSSPFILLGVYLFMVGFLWNIQ
jgi:hypothetical protein